MFHAVVQFCIGNKQTNRETVNYSKMNISIGNIDLFSEMFLAVVDNRLKFI